MRKQKQEEYKGYRTAGIRLMEPMLAGLPSFSEGQDEGALYPYHLFDKAHLVMLAEEALIPKTDVALMLKELRSTEPDKIVESRMEAGGAMHSGEYLLIRRLGEEVGGRMHLGRSSGDLHAVWRRCRQRDGLITLMGEINRLRGVFLQVAGENLESVMPAYTHSQHAQPTTLGHQLLAWTSSLERCFGRAAFAYSWANQSPAGSAIMTGSDFPLKSASDGGVDGVRRRTAQYL